VGRLPEEMLTTRLTAIPVMFGAEQNLAIVTGVSSNVRFRDVFVPQSDVGDTRSRTDISHLVQFPELAHALALASSLHSA